MPRNIKEKIGDVYRVKTVKTFGDKVKEFLEGLAGCALILTIIYLVFT